VSFQSQVGREEWLRPYTDERLLEYARSGPKRVTLLCPGFATDCLETLEEIAIRNRQLFLEAGGEAYDYIPALNSSEWHVAALTALIERNFQGWAEPSHHTPAQAEATLRRALTSGAPR
jgi:ferrochelatase